MHVLEAQAFLGAACHTPHPEDCGVWLLLEEFAQCCWVGHREGEVEEGESGIGGGPRLIM